MAKYLRPRRGTKTNAIGQNILLKRGEIFLEFPGTTIGNQAGRLIVGDGATSYSNITPFIEDPSLYCPKFDESSFSGMNSTQAINAMGDGSSSSTVTLPTIIGATKQALTKIADMTIDNYNAATAKANNSIFTSSANGLAPKVDTTGGSNATSYLRADGTWQVPPNDNTTYALATTAANGLLPTLNGSSALFLRASRSWTAPPNTTYDVATTAGAGLVPALPANATSVTKFLAADGVWRVPPNDNTTYVLTSVNSGNSTTQVANRTAAYQAFKDIRNNLFKTKNCTITVSAPANGLGSGWAACEISGYHPIAIIAFNTKSNVLHLCTCQLKQGGTNPVQDGVEIAVRNTSSARSANVTVTVLFERDAIA